MTSKSFYQFQIPEADLPHILRFDLLTMWILCVCWLGVVVGVLVCACLVTVLFSLFLIYNCCSSYELSFLLPPLSYPKKELSFSPLFTFFSSNNGTEQHLF